MLNPKYCEFYILFYNFIFFYTSWTEYYKRYLSGAQYLGFLGINANFDEKKNTIIPDTGFKNI